ncbi:expressed unknown protein [Seminavis robusta]|uniref:Uncharacterized protein n=1 Tax=Seminavis robusta TaxID=568900 RepID=A0A9N8DX69_9STRA|nr:expressed unknown protein [Seminavis robusta]|eukprot:Sro361_g126500.1 n/a (232) ;mRNA; f:30401-31185
MLLTKPRALLKNVYGLTIDHDDDELIAWELRGIGSLGLGLAIQVYASIVQGIAPITAMGLGLIPRALFYLYTTFSGKMKSLNIQTRFFTMNTVMTCWCVASLLLGLGKPSTTSKIYSSMCFLKSLFFTWAPRTSCKKLLGRPCEGQALGLMRGAGNELFVSSLLMLSAAWASNIVSPVAAAGYVCVAWVVLLADMAMLAKTWQLMGFSNARTNWVNLIMAAVLGTGFLLAK